jgi:YidC/Oxa1 family membrane protein insertase
LVLLVWNFFFTPQPPPPSSQPAPTAEPSEALPVETSEQTVPDSSISESGSAKPLQITPQDDRTPAREIEVETPLYRVVISERGGVFRQFVLKNYQETLDGGGSLKKMIDPQLKEGIFQIGFTNQSIPNLGSAVFKFDVEQESLTANQEPVTLSCTWTSPQGIRLIKEFVFNPVSYLIDMRIRVENESGQTIQDSLWVSMQKVFPKDNRAYGFSGPSTYINNELEQVKIKKIEETEPLTGSLKWMALQDRYFILSLIPKGTNDGTLLISVDDANIVENRYKLPNQGYGAGSPAHEFQIYVGPKSMKVLKSFNNGLDKAINFGMFDIIAKPLLWLMNFIHDNLVANYGIAIIILTIITKIVFWPLGNKSYKSMNEMKKLQPLIAEIREKYKDDRQRQNQETMALYKTYKVNPMGGCLPMLVQIPVFFALYRMLYEAIELRHAPFMGWINDLSAPDRLGDFGFSIPLMEAPYGIPVLTLVMGASMFLQQKMSPPVGDPTQAKMMMFMPILFTFIFINFSSGLVLYWLVNNLISIGQQYYTQKKNFKN